MLTSSPKRYESYKSAAPEDTVRRIEDGFARLGFTLKYSEKNVRDGTFFSGVARLHGLDWSANGKGTSSILSRASAYAELAERFSAGLFFQYYPYDSVISAHDLLFRGFNANYEAVARLADYAYMPGHRTVMEKDAGGFRRFLNLAESFPTLPEDLEKRPDLCHWVDAYSVGENRWLPVPNKLLRTISGSNGLAAGNTREEAVAQGACEVFERYATLRIFRDRLPAPVIDTSSLSNDRIRKWIEAFTAMGVRVTFRDFSLGGRLPVVAAVFEQDVVRDNPVDADINGRHLSVGAGFSLDEAMTRCLTEELQGYTETEYVGRAEYGALWEMRPTLFADREYAPARSLGHPVEFRMFLQRYLTVGDFGFPESPGAAVATGDWPFQASLDFREDVDAALAVCRAHGTDLLVLDHTHPKLNFPTVRVVVPGMSAIFSEGYHDAGVRGYDDYCRFSRDLWYPGLTEAVIASFGPDCRYESFVENAEAHLANYPFDYVVSLRDYGLINDNLYNLLARIHLRRGDFDRARRYRQFHRRIMESMGVVPDDRHAQAFPAVARANPFVNACPCEQCTTVRPRLYGQAVRSFLG